MAPSKRNANHVSQNDVPSSSKTLTKTGKLPVAEPSSFSKFIVILAMHICKKILIVDIFFKVSVYVCGTTVVSLVTDLLPPPETYFANKKNPLNVYLVKWGWAWTCTILGTFVYLTSSVYCIGNRPSILRGHMTRLAVATAWWYIAVTFMDYIEHVTGFCRADDPKNFPSKQQCKLAGHDWISWDPSGHVFLLIHCLLTIAEEVKVFSTWEQIPNIIQNKDGRPSWTLNESEKTRLQTLYENNTPYIRICIVALTILQLIWEIMLLATCVYFHNMPSKLIGALLAVAGWLVTYQWWYKLVQTGHQNGPTLPGVGRVKYL